MTIKAEQDVYDCLSSLLISYTRHQHPPVYTVEEAEEHWKKVEGAHCKNIFVRNKKGNRHFLIIAEAHKKIDLNSLAKRVGQSRFSFASPERLMRVLGLEAGSVSPFGLLNDREKEVTVLIDRDLKKEGKVNFHPNINTATLTIAFGDFVRFLEHCGNAMSFIDL